MKDPGKYVLYALPALAVSAIALSLLVFAVPRPYAAARLRGGPVEGAPVLSFRLEAFRRLRDIEAPLANETVRIEFVPDRGRRVEWTGTTDSRGLAEVLVRLPGGPVHGSVRALVSSAASRYPLAAGELSLSIAEYLAVATHRGGHIEGNRAGELAISAVPVRGTFAVPYSEELAIFVEEGGTPVAGASVAVSADGALLSYPRGSSTDAMGRLRVGVAPREHAVPVVIRAEQGSRKATFEFTLPVLPGAMRVSLANDSLVVESPIERDVAYVSIVNGVHRVFGAIVPLAVDGKGGSRGVLAFPARIAPGPLWAVVSSEMDTRSMARVGWPVALPGDREVRARETFDPLDHLLLDGVYAGAERDAARQRRVRVLTALFAACAMGLAVAILGLRTRRARAEIEARLADAGEDGTAASRTGPASVWVVVVALLCVALGFAALSLIITFRM